MDPRIRMQRQMRAGRQLLTLWAFVGMAWMLILGGTLGRVLAGDIARLVGM